MAKLLNSVELIDRILIINHSWKASRICFGDSSSLSRSLRDLKSLLQIRLLKSCHPEIYLEIDAEATDEPLFSLRLAEPINGRSNVEHLPVRVAERLLSDEELTLYQSRE